MRIFLLSLAFILCSCAGPTHLYEGELKSQDELGHYSLYGSAGLFTESQAYTLTIDDLDLNNTTKKVWGQVYLKPGSHTVTLSFINYDWKVIPITEFDEAHFKGHYKVNFKVRPGYKYMPMFNLKRKGEKDFFNEMCISESPGTEGWGKLKTADAIIACASANIEVIPENFGCPKNVFTCAKKQG
jgi:hypothetical protein